MIYGFRYNPKTLNVIGVNAYKFGTHWKDGETQKVNERESILFIESDSHDKPGIIGHLKLKPQTIRHWPSDLREKYKDLILEYAPPELLKKYPFLVK